MKFREIIETCDRLYPNLFGFEEKYGFCEELTTLIHTNYFKNTKKIQFKASKDAELPDGLTADRIRSIYVGGVNCSFKALEAVIEDCDGSEITVEYLDIPRYTPDSQCPLSAPFDKLYVYYVIAKICLHNEYIEGYNNYMALYNSLLTDFMKSFSSADTNGTVRFKNLW